MASRRKRKRGRDRRRPPTTRRPYCSACGKMVFPTRATAEGAILAMIRDGRAAEHPRAGEPLNAYPCRRGAHGWHVGHTDRVKAWVRRRKGA